MSDDSSISSRSAEPEGEFQRGPEAGTMYLHGKTFKGLQVRYADINGVAIFEGDIVLGRIDELRVSELRTADGSVLESAVITTTGKTWANGVIPYQIDGRLPDQTRVTDAIQHCQQWTVLKFVERTAANAGQYPDYVRFIEGSGCSSSVGRRGGIQDITLAAGCDAGRTVHEIGHTAGLWHEQGRSDRDTYVDIMWANIDPAYAHDFDQHVNDAQDVWFYDYSSIMHYPRDAFSTNTQDTIVPKQPGVDIGQRTGLSAADLFGLERLYGPPFAFDMTGDPSRQMYWRWCNKCQGLWFGSPQGGVGACPVDRNGHSMAGSGNYKLIQNTPNYPGEARWRCCQQCNSLVFGTEGYPGDCAGGDYHAYTPTGTYTLVHDVASHGPNIQDKWHRCQKCNGLGFAGVGTGVCPAGDDHDYSNSFNYVLVGG